MKEVKLRPGMPCPKCNGVGELEVATGSITTGIHLLRCKNCSELYSEGAKLNDYLHNIICDPEFLSWIANQMDDKDSPYREIYKYRELQENLSDLISEVGIKYAENIIYDISIIERIDDPMYQEIVDDYICSIGDSYVEVEIGNEYYYIYENIYYMWLDYIEERGENETTISLDT